MRTDARYENIRQPPLFRQSFADFSVIQIKLLTFDGNELVVRFDNILDHLDVFTAQRLQHDDDAQVLKEADDECLFVVIEFDFSRDGVRADGCKEAAFPDKGGIEVLTVHTFELRHEAEAKGEHFYRTDPEHGGSTFDGRYPVAQAVEAAVDCAQHLGGDRGIVRKHLTQFPDAYAVVAAHLDNTGGDRRETRQPLAFENSAQ